MGRTLDWLYAHDLTKLFAGLATRARQIFGITAAQVHVDTTSFSVSGENVQGEAAGEAAVIAITYGYPRDHRADLKHMNTSIIRPVEPAVCGSSGRFMNTSLIPLAEPAVCGNILVG